MTASRALGESPTGILLRRVLPNALTPIIVAGTLGIGRPSSRSRRCRSSASAPDRRIAEWGSMIGRERNQLFSAPHLLVFPGIALALTVLAFNLSATACATRSTRG